MSPYRAARDNARALHDAASVPFHEVFVTMGFLAGVTTRIEFCTGILILPQRQTALVAKQAAQLALLSGGRLRLGLANPIVVQRFLWWGLSNLATVILGATLIACLLQGKMILRDPFALFILNMAGTVLSFTWGLSFFPPKFYVRWVEARAGLEN